MNDCSSADNIRYQSGILKFFIGHRDKWEDFYLSEKWAFEKIARERGGFGHILDIGCAVGGLGVALSQRFKVESYTGVDISAPAISWAEENQDRFSIPVRFECEDILALHVLDGRQFDNVFSLSCADWNVDTCRILNRCWEFVKPGGNFILTLRLTPGPGVNDMKRSYQPFAFDEQGKATETANYVVFNVQEIFQLIGSFRPAAESVSAYGYWGNPASTAVTPYKELVFVAMIVTKSAEKDFAGKIGADLRLPLDLFTRK